MKKLFVFIISVMLTISFISCNLSKKISLKSDYNKLKVTILSIGKADAIFISIRNHTILMDTGYDKSSKKILKYMKKNKIHSIDYLIITHFDKDHIGGADKILNKISVKNVIEPNYIGTNKDYKEYINTLDSLNIKAKKITKVQSIIFDNTTITIYPTIQTTFVNEDDNDHSLVTSITHGKNSFLFSGDAEVQRINELYSQMNLKHTFLKVPHHGIYESNSDKFITDVNAKYAVITCSKKFQPDKRTIKALKAVGTKTYLTSEGNVYLTSDRKKINVKQG